VVRNNFEWFILQETDLDEIQPPALWNIPRSRAVNRTATDMAGVVRVLLRMAKTILFVDRNFGPRNKNFRLVLEAFLLSTLDEHKKRQAHRIEYHTGDDLEEGDFTRLCHGRLPDVFPNKVQLRLVRWRSGGLHR
jgi:hypothetical protein